jgi:hypothetical protein
MEALAVFEHPQSDNKQYASSIYREYQERLVRYTLF